MPAKHVWLFAATFLIPTLAHAGSDVGYQLETQIPASSVDGEPLTRDSIALQDRTWATPGVEQSTVPLLPAKPFSFTTRERFHFHFAGDGPYWLDDVCFPLTRQLFHQCERYPNYAVVLCECDGACTPTQEKPLPYGLQR